MTQLVFKWTVEDEVMVVVSGEGVMPADKWAEHMRDLANDPITKVLGLNLGTVQLTSVQRKQASDIAKERGLSSIIVSDSAMTRGIITAVSWLGANIRAFPWADFDGAIKALRLSSDGERRVAARATELRQQCESEIAKNANAKKSG